MIYIYRDKQYYGPFSREEALGYFKMGTFGAQDTAWLEGADVFTTLGALVRIEPIAKLASRSTQKTAPTSSLKYVQQKASLGRLVIWLMVFTAAGFCVFSNKGWKTIRARVTAFAADFRRDPVPKPVVMPKPVPATTPEIPVVVAEPAVVKATTPRPIAKVATPVPFSPAKLQETAPHGRKR